MRDFKANPTPRQDTSANSALASPTRVAKSREADAATPRMTGQESGHNFSRVPVHGNPVMAAAERGTGGDGAPYPFRERIQSGFGRHDIGHIRAHAGSRAAAAARAIGARAFAYGDRVAFDGAPDLHTAAHEAAHDAAQQRRGAAQGQSGQARRCIRAATPTPSPTLHRPWPAGGGCCSTP